MSDHVSARDGSSSALWMGWSLVSVAFLIVLLRTAWIADTAYLLLRTVEHAALGDGLRWNIVERVRVYDDPLWMAVLLGARTLSGETYFTTILLSLCCSAGAFSLMLRHAARANVALIVGLAVLLSPLFMSFSTSGLEAPLLHLLLAALWTIGLRSNGASSSTWWLPALLASLAILTRSQAWLLVTPVVATLMFHSSLRRRLIAAATLVAPWCTWLAGCWWYYGTTSTARTIADAAATVSWQERLALGWRFLTESAAADPLLAALIVVGWLIGWFHGRVGRATVIGGMALTSWTVIQGGSPMAGRDLTMLLVPSTMFIVSALNALATTRPMVARLALAAPLAAAIWAPTVTLASGASYGKTFRPTTRTHDQRADDYQASGLLLATRTQPMPLDPETQRARTLTGEGARVAVTDHPGFFGAGADSRMYVLDPAGIVDPLLSRLPPAVGARWIWRAERRIPDGYVESLTSGDNRVAESPIARLYDDARHVTQDPLMSAGRASGIRHLSSTAETQVARSSFGTKALPFSRVDDPNDSIVSIGEGGVAIELGAPRNVGRLTMTLSRIYDYEIELLNVSRLVDRFRLPRTT